MKVQIICPNRNLSEWRELAKALGEDVAMLSFIRNQNQIPTVERAKEILGIKEAVTPSKPPAVPEPKPAATTPGQITSKSKTPKAIAPKTMGLKRIRGGKFLSRPHRQVKARATSKASAVSSV